MSNPLQLYMLADHIKLLLLDSNAQDGSISRSLDSMREGVQALEAESIENSELADQASDLRAVYDDLTSKFRDLPASTSTSAPAEQRIPSLRKDFSAAQTLPASSSLRSPVPLSASKSVRFSDNPDAEDAANRAALFPYRDDPSNAESPDHSAMSNQGIHAYHATVLAQQDEQLDALGFSIGRQRDLSIQIGDELDEHVQMLDEVDRHVDRHQGRLDGARKSLGRFARKANDNKQITTIVILIVILVLLIIILKR